MKKILITAAIALTSITGYCDWGSVGLNIVCDPEKNYFSMEPIILWNEELNEFSRQYPEGVKEEGITNTYQFEKLTDKKITNICALSKKQIITTLENGHKGAIKINEDNNEIFNKKPSWIWRVHGPTYEIKFDNSNWLECCGHVSLGVTCGPIEKTERIVCSSEGINQQLKAGTPARDAASGAP